MLITKFINIFKVGKVFLNSKKKKKKKKKKTNKKKNKSSKIYILVLAANIFKDFFFSVSQNTSLISKTLIPFVKVLDTCRLRIIFGLKCLAYM